MKVLYVSKTVERAPERKSYSCKASGRKFITRRSGLGLYYGYRIGNRIPVTGGHKTQKYCEMGIEQYETKRLEAEARIGG